MIVPRKLLITFFVILILIPVLSLVFVWVRDGSSIPTFSQVFKPLSKIFRKDLVLETATYIPGYKVSIDDKTKLDQFLNQSIAGKSLLPYDSQARITPQKILVVFTKEAQSHHVFVLPNNQPLTALGTRVSRDSSNNEDKLELRIYFSDEALKTFDEKSLSKWADFMFVTAFYDLLLDQPDAKLREEEVKTKLQDIHQNNSLLFKVTKQ